MKIGEILSSSPSSGIVPGMWASVKSKSNFPEIDAVLASDFKVTAMSWETSFPNIFTVVWSFPSLY